ncbi:hypothetical protein QWY82_06820 [Simiduia curdlanivorans]|uniref:DUF1349 domain-containing protein n=1 Tax=Simiduia curdlanivorans TaxID=1492769 RepID=A0ABV8V911_9GAMM|nr:hypothetical protein [Simiduia curdlanivorans]MDN3638517.1 hypothetical protein [Simiduia curdlanivorans]
MKSNMTVISLVFILFAALALLVAALMLVSSKRDSTYFRWTSSLLSPVTETLHAWILDYPELARLDNEKNSAVWRWFQPGLVDKKFDGQKIFLQTLHESVWYHNQRGPMMYRYFAGDGELSARIKTRKSSDLSSFPDAEWQFGGIIFRDPKGDAWFARENYVFNVIGFRRDKLQLEMKTTRDGRSDVSAIDWPSGDADLSIVRRGEVFTIKAKSFDEPEWQVLAVYNRPDLAQVLQVGVIVYSFSEGRRIFDLSAQVENLRLKQH